MMMIFGRRLLAIVAALTMVSSVRVAADEPVSIAKPRACRTDFASAPDLDERLARAAADVRACERAGAIDPKLGRRALSAIEDLRGDAAYDRRRAHGGLSERRELQLNRRLEYLMYQVTFH